MPGLIVRLLSILWRAAVIKTGVQWLSPERNERKERATYGNAVTIAVILWALSGLLTVLYHVSWLLFFGGWVAYAAVYLWIFVSYFGLGFWRTVGIALLEKLGLALLAIMLGMLPLFDHIHVWRVLF